VNAGSVLGALVTAFALVIRSGPTGGAIRRLWAAVGVDPLPVIVLFLLVSVIGSRACATAQSWRCDLLTANPLSTLVTA
jgi:hypothetical protein